MELNTYKIIGKSGQRSRKITFFSLAFIDGNSKKLRKTVEMIIAAFNPEAQDFQENI